MTDGMTVGDGKIVVIKDGRTVFTTDGQLINMLPSPFVETIPVVFPDFNKGKAYRWSWESDYNSIADQYGWTCDGACQFTVLPQEWSATTVVGSVPEGADLFWSRMRINRTVAPSHTWIGQSIDVQPPQNVWIPGQEGLLEAEFNMARMFSIYIDGDDLKLFRQQTVGPASGGFGTAGNASPSSLTDTSGQTWHHFGTTGMPVYINQSAPYAKSSSGTTGIIPPYEHYQKHKWNGSDPASQTDPTNYASTYSVDVYGQFARRS